MARSGKVGLEDGTFRWPESGSRYEPPAEGGGLPPGWFQAPHEDQPDVWPAPSDDRRTPREAIDRTERPVMMEANISTPSERVNLDTGTASFMGYDFPMTLDTIASVKILLAAEVCLILERERDRILGTLQRTLPSPTSTGGPNVPEVSGQEGPVDQAPQT